MKKSFSEYLKEHTTSFYNLYTTEFPSKELKKMPAGKEKDEKTKAETIKYKKLMTDFLQYVGAMNK